MKKSKFLSIRREIRVFRHRGHYGGDRPAALARNDPQKPADLLRLHSPYRRADRVVFWQHSEAADKTDPATGHANRFRATLSRPDADREGVAAAACQRLPLRKSIDAANMHQPDRVPLAIETCECLLFSKSISTN